MTRINSYLEELSAYNQSMWADSRLNILREFEKDPSKYYFLGAAVPYSNDLNFNARETREFTVSLQPGTYVLMITGYSDQPEGFKLNLFDKGSKTYLVNGQWVIGAQIAPSIGAVNPVLPDGPYMVPSVFPLVTPGVLTVQITNQATVAAIIQIMLSCAVPNTNQSNNLMAITKEGAL